MKKIQGLKRGVGIGGWLTNYKRFQVLPEERKMLLTIGDYEHFESYITEDDVANIASLGMDHIRVGFDQIVLEEEPYKYRERTFRLLDNFIGWCRKYQLGCVLNLHKAVGNYCDVPSPVQLLDDDDLQNRFIAFWLECERRWHDQEAPSRFPPRWKRSNTTHSQAVNRFQASPSYRGARFFASTRVPLRHAPS